jgi:SulP family sulfate permease
VIITAFWGGLAAAFCGGSEFNIVGPTGALSGILSAAAAVHGPQVLPWLSLWTGVMAFFVWSFKLIDYILFVPNSVMHGFTFGVAVLIGFGQIDSALGLSFKHQYTEFYMRVLESFYYAPSLTNFRTCLFFAANFGALVTLIPRYPKVPWAVILTIVGIVVGMLNGQEGAPLHSLITLEDKYGDFKLSLIEIPSIVPGSFSKDIIYSSFAVSFIAILETLISGVYWHIP